MDDRGRMQNENEDDIDVLSNGDTQHIIDDAIEPLIDIRSAQRQQLFYSNAGNNEDNAASLHSLKLSYDALKKRYNELEIKNQTMQKVIAEIETERLGKERLNPRVSLVGCDAAGPAASASPDAGSAEGSMANVRAHLGYAQRLERQNLRLQMSMEEQTQKFRKNMETLHNQNDQLKQLVIEKDEEIKKLKGKSPERGSNSQNAYEKEIMELKEQNSKLLKEVESKEETIFSMKRDPQTLSSSFNKNSIQNEHTLMIDNRKILEKIRDQNKIIQVLHEQITEQRQMIEDQTNLVKRVVEAAKASGVSLSSSVMDLSRRIDGSSMAAAYNDPRASSPQSPRSPRSPLDKIQSSGNPTTQVNHFSNYPKSAMSSSSAFRNMSAPVLQPDHHDGNIPQSSNSSKTSQQGINSTSLLPPLQDSKIPNQTGARPKVGSAPSNIVFSPLIDDFSMNPSQTKQADVKKNSNVNVKNYEPVPEQNQVFPPNLLRQGEIIPKQPQQNTEVIASRLNRADAQETYNDFSGKPPPLWTGNSPPRNTVSPQRIENSFITNSGNLFGSIGQRFDDKTFKIPQQNEELLNSGVDQIVENDYVNVWGGKDTASKRVSQETAGPGNVANPVNRCPVCSQEFPGMDIQDFQMHVIHCIDDSNDEPQTIQNPVDANNRICPMCDAVFPSELPQEEFENHVQEHFGEERFEVLNT